MGNEGACIHVAMMVRIRARFIGLSSSYSDGHPTSTRFRLITTAWHSSPELNDTRACLIQGFSSITIAARDIHFYTTIVLLRTTVRILLIP